VCTEELEKTRQERISEYPADVCKVVAYIHAGDKQEDGDKSGKLIHLDVTGSGQIFRVSTSSILLLGKVLQSNTRFYYQVRF
jgi:hypothetical protein